MAWENYSAGIELRVSSEDDEAVFENLISNHHFGAGFEFHAYEKRIGVLEELATDFGVGMLRYPGGTQTENYFDLSGPNETALEGVVKNIGVENEVVPLSQFLEFADRHSASVVIVLPTWRYFDQTSRKITSNAEFEIKNFVRKLLSDDFGRADVLAFEIGNEWFNRSIFDWSATEFGELQSTMCLWVKEAIEDLGISGVPEIWIQSKGNGSNDIDKSGVNDNIEIRRAFSETEISAVDGIVDHFYQPVRAKDPLDKLNSQWVSTTRTQQLRDAGWDISSDEGIELISTEWNVRAERSENISGFERLPVFLGLFADMIQNDIKAASVWTLQAIGSGNGALSRKGSSELTPTGMLFDMLSGTVGSKLVDPNGDGLMSREEYLVSAADGSSVGYKFTFVSSYKTDFFFASGVPRSVEVALEFGNNVSTASLLSVSLLTPVAGEDPLSDSSNGSISKVFEGRLTEFLDESKNISFLVDPHSVLHVEISVSDNQSAVLENLKSTNNQGVNVVEQDAIHAPQRQKNSFFASRSNSQDIDLEELSGSEGNDVMYGSLGRDYIDGRGGDDTIFGGGDGINSGLDRLYGGDGNDVIYASDDGAHIFGQAGDDKMVSGKCNDLLSGGSGSDIFVFSNNFGQDVIVDFDNTQDRDRIDLSAISLINGFSDLLVNHVTQIKSDAVIYDGKGHTITLHDFEVSEFSLDDFIFW